MKKNFDLIIFDWDGTLIDSIDWIARCLQNVAPLKNYPVPDYQAAKDVIGLSIDKAIRALYPMANKETEDFLVAEYDKAYFSKHITREDLFTGTYELLTDLKNAGYLLAIATGKTRLGLNEALNATQTEDLFAITRCADETESKPHPKMLYEIIETLGVDKNRTLMVGDSTHDLQMAYHAQIASIGIATGAHSFEQLLQEKPLQCFQHVTELRSFLSFL